MQKYILPLLTAVLILLFYLGLPELSKVSLIKQPKKLDRKDGIIMLVFCLVFGFADFSGLGDKVAPESFVNMNGQEAVFDLGKSLTVYEFSLYSGVGYGTYTIDFSADGEDYNSELSFTQDAGDVLRWNYIYTDPAITQGVRYVRIRGEGNAYLGEVVIIDELSDEGYHAADASVNISELNDEQEKYCPKYSFMNSSYFDEIYHARTAWEHLNNVYPYEISHPPLGKLIISIGIALFGMTPFGWRFSGTLLGVLMLPIMYVFIKKLFGSRKASIAGTLVFAADFMHFVQTRIATIDVYAVFFILLMYLFMYIFVFENKLWALALSGIFFGMGAASKWTCIYAGAGLAVIWAIYRVVNRRRGFAAFLSNSGFCVVFFIMIPCVIYYLSYIPYGTSQGVYNVFSKEYLKIVIDNQVYMFNYHSKLVATHPYSSVWYQWVLDIRPILYYLNYDGAYRQSFGAFVNPMLCWGGFLALFALGYEAVFRKDREALFIIIGYLAQLIPWVFVTRLTFEYHYFPCTVFLVLAVSYIFFIMENGNKRKNIYIFGFAGVSAALFILFFPVLAGIRVNSSVASNLMQWLPTWPF